MEPSGRKSVIEALTEELRRLKSDDEEVMTAEDVDALLTSALQRCAGDEEEEDVTTAPNLEEEATASSQEKKCLIEEISTDEKSGAGDAKSSANKDSSSSQEDAEKKTTGSSIAAGSSRLAEKLRAAAAASTSSSASQLPQVLEALREIEDPMVPVCGHGLIVLRRLLERRDPHCLAQGDVIMAALRSCLEHEDSYVYLLAINALQAFAFVDPQLVLTTLAHEYANFDRLQVTAKEAEAQRVAAEVGLEVERPADLRMKIGEALMKGVRLNGRFLLSSYPALSHSQ